MGQKPSSTLNSNDSQHAHHRDVYQQQQPNYFQTIRQKMFKMKPDYLPSSSPPHHHHQAHELSARTSSSDMTPLNSTSAATPTRQDKFKYSSYTTYILRSTVIQIIQDEILSDCTMTFTQDDIEKRRATELRYKRHQTQHLAALDQDDYIRATIAYMLLKQLTRSLARPILTSHPRCLFSQLPLHVQHQLVDTLNQQAFTKYHLFIEKSKNNWLAIYFLYRFFRDYKFNSSRLQRKRQQLKMQQGKSERRQLTIGEV